MPLFYLFSLSFDENKDGIRIIPAIPTKAYIIRLIIEYVPPNKLPIASTPRNPMIPQFNAPIIVKTKHIFLT